MSKYSNLSDKQLLAAYNQEMSRSRKLLSKLTSLLKSFFGKTFSAFAADVILDVNSEDGAAGKADTLHVSKFKAPSERKLRAYVEALELADQLDNMGELHKALSKSVNPELKANAENLKRMIDALNLSYNKALDAMTEIANKSIPDSVGELFNAAAKAITKINGEGADDVFVYVGAEAGKGVHFVQTLDISSWERESHTPVLAIIVTAVLDEQESGGFQMRVFLNVHDRAVLPFRYNLGEEIVGASLQAITGKFAKEIEHTLAIHKVVAVIAPAALTGVDDVEVTALLTEIKGVKGVNVFEDSIEVEIPTNSRDTIANVVNALKSYRPIAKLFNKGFSPSFREQGDGIYAYTVSRKGAPAADHVEVAQHNIESEEEAAADKKRIQDNINFKRRSAEVKSTLEGISGVVEATVEQTRIIVEVAEDDDDTLEEIENAIMSIRSVQAITAGRKTRAVFVKTDDSTFEFSVVPSKGDPVKLNLF